MSHKRPPFWSDLTSDERKAWRRMEQGLAKDFFNRGVKFDVFLTLVRTLMEIDELSPVLETCRKALIKHPTNKEVLLQYKTADKMVVDKRRQVQQFYVHLGIDPTVERNAKAKAELEEKQNKKKEKQRKARPWEEQHNKVNRRGRKKQAPKQEKEDLPPTKRNKDGSVTLRGKK